MSRHVIARIDELPAGGRKLVNVKGRPIVIFNVNGEFFALLNRCPHQGGSLCHGELGGLVEAERAGAYRYSRHGEIIRCPWHGWEFDIRTGQSWCEPERIQVKRYPVDVERGGHLVEGPYVAETFPVAVEEQYVVVEV
ncbi:MAG: Rieske (2Fe-2S) protein [Geminicoccaceae bacterium]